MSRQAQAVTFTHSGSGEFPFEAQVGGERWVVRVNDWPEEEFLYTLLVDGEEAESFTTWPSGWIKPATPQAMLDALAAAKK